MESPVALIEIYTTPYCGYCSRTKDLLRRKGATFTEIDIAANGTRRLEMIERAKGRSTVPQIFIAGRHVGGCDDLYELERGGRLDPLLAGK